MMRLDRGQIEVVDDAMAAVLRGMSGADRLRIASGMYASARSMLISHLRCEHADWSEQRIIEEAARRLSHGEIDSVKDVIDLRKWVTEPPEAGGAED